MNCNTFVLISTAISAAESNDSFTTWRLMSRVIEVIPVAYYHGYSKNWYPLAPLPFGIKLKISIYRSMFMRSRKKRLTIAANIEGTYICVGIPCIFHKLPYFVTFWI